MVQHQLEWFERLPCSVTVCDQDYRILYMNEKAAEATADEGGRALVGKSLMDCHPPEAQEKLRKVMGSKRPNVYTTEKNGKKKLVYQCQWSRGTAVGGLVEFWFELPKRVPNHVRK
jgi:transcriptional regulator with PAS, ATPase and Fis domain